MRRVQGAFRLGTKGSAALVVVAWSLGLPEGVGAKLAASAPAGGLSATAAKQVAALQRVKPSLSPAERKLDSRLVGHPERRGVPAQCGPRRREAAHRRRGHRRRTTDVDIRATVPSDLLARLEGAARRSATRPGASARSAPPCRSRR